MCRRWPTQEVADIVVAQIVEHPSNAKTVVNRTPTSDNLFVIRGRRIRGSANAVGPSALEG
jgi:hypothetical protein